jgi:hypothetical protein
MSQHTTPASATSSNTPAMTPAEALAIFHHVYDAVGWHLYDASATEEEQLLRNQIGTAFRTLCTAIHGKAPMESMSSLCDVCYLRYPLIATPLVRLKESPHLSKASCAQCLEQLKAEGKLAEIIDWKTGEVTPC